MSDFKIVDLQTFDELNDVELKTVIGGVTIADFEIGSDVIGISGLSDISDNRVRLNFDTSFTGADLLQ